MVTDTLIVTTFEDALYNLDVCGVAVCSITAEQLHLRTSSIFFLLCPYGELISWMNTSALYICVGITVAQRQSKKGSMRHSERPMSQCPTNLGVCLFRTYKIWEY